jgi:hypothetical protein
MKPSAWMVCVTLVTGCAGARTDVVAPNAQVPVSLSRGVRDREGNLVDSSHRVLVGRFRQDKTVWGLFYAAVKLNPETDLSTEINQQVARAGGDAVVRLVIRSKPCGMNYVPLLDLLPFWPGCARIQAEGDIVKVVRTVPSATTASAVQLQGGAQ